MDNRIMDLTTADNIIQEIASKGVTQINRLILFGGEPFLNIELFMGTSKNTSRASRASNLSLIYSLFLVNFCL